MFKSFSKIIICVLAVSSLLVACHDGPKQYRSPKYKADQPDLTAANQANLTEQNMTTEQEKSEAENRSRIENNAKSPIVYGQGAAGITFSTTLQQAKDILSKPKQGEDEKDGSISYQEGVYVFWKRDEPRTPAQILITGAYLGKFPGLSEYFKHGSGPIGIGESFESEFAKDGGKGIEFIKDLTRFFLKADESYDCIKLATCSVEPRGVYIRFNIPSGLLTFSSDRKVLSAIALLPVYKLGQLDNPFDLLQGSFKDLKIGDSWGVAKTKLEENQKSKIYPLSFEKDYGNVVLLATRKRAEQNYIEPTDEEKLHGFSVRYSFRHPILLNSQYVEVKVEKNKVDVNLLPLEKIDEKTNLLKVNIKGVEFEKPVAQFEFVSKLSRKILLGLMQNKDIRVTAYPFFSQVKREQENIDLNINSAYSGISNTGSQVVSQSLIGLQRSISQGAMESMTIVFDLLNRQGQFVNFVFDRAKGGFNVLKTSSMLKGGDLLVAQSLAQPVDAAARILMGLSLKKPDANLTNLDVGRSEAMLWANSQAGVVEELVKLTPDDSIELTYPKRSPQVFNVTTVEVSSLLKNKLYFLKSGANHKLIAVQSAYVIGGVKGLCGLEGFLPRKTMSASRFLNEYEEAAKKAREKAEANKEQFDCPQHIDKDKDGTGELKAVTFIKERVKLIFEDNELHSVMFYGEAN